METSGTTYGVQTPADSYLHHSYRKQERWDSFWHQIDLIKKSKAESVLEIGPGPGVVTHALKGMGIQVTTCDIAEDLAPDVVGSITAIPRADASFDVVVAAEVLEHIQAQDVGTAFKEIARVVRKGAIISVPSPGASFLLNLKLPLIPRLHFFIKVPFFWKTHTFDGQHYWELDTRGRSFAWFVRQATDAGLVLTSTRMYPDAPYHRFFVFEKSSKK